jgi:hypothetical protein
MYPNIFSVTDTYTRWSSFLFLSIFIKQTTDTIVYAGNAALNFADGITPTVDVVENFTLSSSLPRTLQIYCMFNQRNSIS